MSKRSKATDIPKKVREEVYRRHKGLCLWCVEKGLVKEGIPNVHYIPRSQGGLGIVENVLNGCVECHHEFDNGKGREWYQKIADKYMIETYPDFTDEMRTYDKWRRE